MSTDSAAKEELDAGLNAAALVDRSACGRLRVTGSQRLTYLQRIAAQDFSSLEPPRGVRAAILERRGKILDVVTAHAFADHLLILTSAALHVPAAEWIGKFIFRDDVQVVDQTDETVQFLLVGPAAAEVAGSLAGPEAIELAPHAWLEISESPGALLIGGAPDSWSTYYVVAPRSVSSELRERILEVGKSSGLRPMGEEAYQALRVLSGVPEGGAEIDEQYNPMELGLDDSYSLTKGCFPGQEVLAKMVTHKSVKRRLTGLEFEPGSSGSVGASLLRDGKSVGRLTSVVSVPGRNRTVGLALVGREDADPGTRLHLEGENAARVVAPPFPI